MKKILAKYWWVLPVLFIAGPSLYSVTNVYTNKTAKESDCTGGAANDFKCWEKRYQTIIDKQSPKEAFADVRRAYATVPYVKTNCHQIAHTIGRAAADKYKDVVVAYGYGEDFCWSGYYHGVMERIVSNIGLANIDAQLSTICEPARTTKPYSFYHFNCVHGLGHGIMAIKQSELFESLKTCDKLEGLWQQESCYGGVYMENVMDEVNADHTSKYLKKDDPLYPCTAVDTKYKKQCYLMQTSHALIVVNGNYDKVFDLCSTIDTYDAICYQSLGRDISGNSSSDKTKTIELCQKGPSFTAKENCYIGAVKDFISYYHNDKEGLEMCNAIPNTALKITCTSTAQSYYGTF